MSYLKLCQIISQGNPNSAGIPQTIYYLSDCNGNQIVNSNLVYPSTFTCELIEWQDQNGFIERQEAVSFKTVEVILSEPPPIPVRQMIYAQLKELNSDLVL